MPPHAEARNKATATRNYIDMQKYTKILTTRLHLPENRHGTKSKSAKKMTAISTNTFSPYATMLHDLPLRPFQRITARILHLTKFHATLFTFINITHILASIILTFHFSCFSKIHLPQTALTAQLQAYQHAACGFSYCKRYALAAQKTAFCIAA